MKFKLIYMDMNRDEFETIYRSRFNYHVFFVGYFLSQQLKKKQFDTDDVYEALFITVGRNDGPDFKKDNSVWKFIEVNIRFDAAKYDNRSESERCRYYIELYKEALVRANKVATIPLEWLLEQLDVLTEMNYIDSWKFRNMLIRPWGLKICFTATLTTNDFTIRAVVYKTGVKAPVCEGQVVRTKPDSLYFGDLTKNMRVEDGKVFIGNTRSDYFYLDLAELSRGDFLLHLCEPSSNRSEDSKETYRHLQLDYMYEGNDL